jgi:hypothetical protein
MATQIVQPTRGPLRRSSQRKLVGKAQLLAECVRLYTDAGSVEEFQQLYCYLTAFLRLPPDVLREWEQLPEDELRDLARRVPDKVLYEITGVKQ